MFQDELGFLIEKSKNDYYSKLNLISNKATSSKAYWSILKTFLNDKKILCISSVFRDNKFAIDFREKKLNFLIQFLKSNVHNNNSELSKNVLFLDEKHLNISKY